jgi:hypothetical protein
MKVYVVITGQATYEDNVKVIGVCRTFTDGVNLGMKETIVCKDNAQWGDYWYDVEEWEVT